MNNQVKQMICSFMSGNNIKVTSILTWSEGKALASRRILNLLGVGLKNDSCNEVDLLKEN